MQAYIHTQADIEADRQGIQKKGAVRQHCRHTGRESLRKNRQAA